MIMKILTLTTAKETFKTKTKVEKLKTIPKILDIIIEESLQICSITIIRNYQAKRGR